MRLYSPVFSALGLSVAASVMAQENRPYFYLWDAPTGVALPIPGMSQMVRGSANDYWTAEGLAQTLAVAADDQVIAGATDPNHICIVLTGFGEKTSGSLAHFFDPADEITPEPVWINNQRPSGPPGSANPADMPYLQPWMGAGRTKVHQWMVDFIAEYRRVNGRTPHRFHFDFERHLTSSGSTNWTRILYALPLDPRWGGPTALVVPGYGMTMEQLYAVAKDKFGWQGELRDALSIVESPHSDQNRPYYLWYTEICERALDAVMYECAYDLIQHHTPGWENVLVSNYADCKMDGKLDSFGWYTGRAHTLGPPHPEPPLIPTRLSNHGWSWGDYYWWNDFIERDQGGNIVRRSLYATEPGTASGDFSAPELYPVFPGHFAPDRKQYYLYDWPQETRSSAMLSVARRQVESILNSPGGDPTKIAPWVPSPGTPPWHATSSYPQPPESHQTEFRRLLAMLRAKKIPEILLWWDVDPQFAFIPPWSSMLQIMEQVYHPHILTAEVLSGTAQYTVLADQLRYTFRGPQSTEIATIQSGPSSTVKHVVALKVTYNDFGSNTGAQVLNLECSISPPLDSIAGTRGRIYVWNPASSDWQGVPIQDYPLPADQYEFGFFAPANDDTDGGWFETRRSFIVPLLKKPDGTMDIKIVFTRPNTTGFTVKFDLAQLVGAPDVLGDPDTGSAQGGDFDYSSSVDFTDLNAFLAAFAIGGTQADVNNDGVVDPLDFVVFMIRYNSP